ncbi:MAG TPA: NAD(P)/FAD-dependent oxidoreductase [Clostridiales bacterium]|nr:NAD(P)/FAD-dependent oxidoreductase [Clostridiales bacterium]
MRYDFVVVGSGCAGLAAACELKQAGKKVLLIEQHNLPGGCASSFVRGRFEFDPSLHELCTIGSVENPGITRKQLEAYGVNINWQKVPDCFRIVSEYSDGSLMDVTMPSGKEAFIAKMAEYVPDSKKATEDMFELFAEISAGLEYTSQGDENLNGKVLMEKFPNLLKIGSYPCMPVFKKLGFSQKAIDILSTYWSYLGVDMDHLSFLHYSQMVESYVELSAYIPEHTSHEISVAMVEAFRNMGGECLFNCRATEFIFDNKKCVGVKTTAGDIECDCVLANINPDIIYAKMMPEHAVPEREKRLSAARKGRYGARMFTAHFGLNKTAEELGIKDYSIFMPSTADSSKEYESLKKIATNNYTIFLCYNIVNPNFSPEGTSVVSFTTTYTSPEDWNKVTQENYFNVKDEIAKKFVGLLKEKTGIDIKDAIEEVAIASPMTFSRYLGVPEGSAYGFETRDWDGIIARTMGMEFDYTINGLIPIGTSGIRGDGYSSNYACGQLLARYALNKQGGNK